jgi:hypothetical protein
MLRQRAAVGAARLGASSEPVTLERLDDLAEPFQLGRGGRALGDQRRLEGFDIVRDAMTVAVIGSDYSIFTTA